MRFGDYLKFLRQSKTTLSQSEVAEELGVTQRYLSQIEKNLVSPPTFSVCEKLCLALTLNEDDKKELFSRAAFDRFKNVKANQPFLKYLLDDHSSKTDRDSSSFATKSYTYFSMSWKWNPVLDFQDLALLDLLTKYFLKYSHKQGATFLDINLKESPTFIILEIPLTISPYQFITSNFKYLSQIIYKKYSHINLNYKTIAPTGITICSLSQSDVPTSMQETLIKTYKKD